MYELLGALVWLALVVTPGRGSWSLWESVIGAAMFGAAGAIGHRREAVRLGLPAWLEVERAQLPRLEGTIVDLTGHS